MIRRALARPIPVPSNPPLDADAENPEQLVRYRGSKPTPLSRTKTTHSSGLSGPRPISISAGLRGRVYFRPLDSNSSARSPRESGQPARKETAPVSSGYCALWFSSSRWIEAAMSLSRSTFPRGFPSGPCGKIEQVVDQTRHFLGRALDLLDEPTLLRREGRLRGFRQQLDEARDVAQRSPEVVGDRVGKRFEFLVGGFKLGRASRHARSSR